MPLNLGSSAVSLYLGSQAVNAYLGGTLVTPPLARTLYFTGVAADGDWSNLSNWFDNAEGTVAASSLPAAGDSVIATTNIGVITGDATFTASSYDSYPQQGTVDGDVVFTNVTVGCTDSDADNYNSSATLDNGSCTYPPPPEE